jgi:transcriptional regulator of arginine metabolism
MSSKAQRQQMITTMIEQHAVINQPQLVELLAEHGVSATQATVSRDLEDLGAVKVRVPGGEAVYAIPEFAPARLAPEDQLRRVMNEWVADVRSSGPMVVIRTPPGCAHVVASALDRSGFDGLLGTVAGDDTIFCIADEDMGGANLAKLLSDLAGIDPAVARKQAKSKGTTQ